MTIYKKNHGKRSGVVPEYIEGLHVCEYSANIIVEVIKAGIRKLEVTFQIKKRKREDDVCDVFFKHEDWECKIVIRFGKFKKSLLYILKNTATKEVFERKLPLRDTSTAIEEIIRTVFK